MKKAWKAPLFLDEKNELLISYPTLDGIVKNSHATFHLKDADDLSAFNVVYPKLFLRLSMLVFAQPILYILRT